MVRRQREVRVVSTGISFSIKAFDIGMLTELMEPDYQLYPIYASSQDCGHAGVSRERLYIILRHIQSTDCIYDPMDLYHHIKTYIMARAQTLPCDYMIATGQEILLEALATAQKRKIPFRPGEKDLRYLLNARETDVLTKACDQYWARFHRDPCQDPNLAIFLGDNVEYSLTWSAVSGKIPTFRLNSGKTFFPFLRRWMCSSERLASFGFPVRRDVAEWMGVPPVLIKDQRRASELAGNCMLLPTVAIVQLVALACVASKKATGSLY